jgi:hypothetical protein
MPDDGPGLLAEATPVIEGFRWGGGGPCACASSKCCSKSWRESNVRPQQVKSFMKFASILGKYDDEWNDGDWLNAAGDVPDIIMLQDVLVVCGSRCGVQGCTKRGNRLQQTSWNPRVPQLLYTYSSRIQLPTDTPPQLMPLTKLPVLLSLLGLSFMAMGLAPAP